jgi:hypothetical protein
MIGGGSRIAAGKGDTLVMETSYELGSPISVVSTRPLMQNEKARYAKRALDISR